MATVPHRSPFRYPGGKTWLIPYIRSWLRDQRKRPSLLIEPFAGGAIVGLTAGFEQLADHVVLVESDPDISSVWQTILFGQATWLADKIEQYPFSQENVLGTLQQEPMSHKERAFSIILRNRVQRGGIMALGAGLVKNGENGRGLGSRWYPTTLARRIREINHIHDRFSYIEGNGVEILRRYANDQDVAFFVDPPYTVASKRLYKHWQIDHRGLFQSLSKVRGSVLLTYDNTVEISALAREFGFETAAVAMKNTHHAKMSELLISKDLKWLRDATSERESPSQMSLETTAFPR